MLWNLRALRDLNREKGQDCGGGAHLDVLYKRLGQLLRIPQDLLELEYPPDAQQEGFVVRHRMQFALTYLNFLGLVNSQGQGDWSLADEGAEFLNPLDEEDAPMAERDWNRETGIELTPVEMLLSNTLMADQRADHRTRFPRNPPTPPERPDDWPEGPFRSRGAPPRTAEEEESLEGVKALTAFLEEAVTAQAMSKLRRFEGSPRTLVARFEGICVICDEPINIGDAIAIVFQIAYQDAPSDVEGWRHDRCSRRGPGGARVPARVPSPGNPPKESAVRRR